MKRTFRKQTRQDFRGRVKRIDPVFFRKGDAAYAKDKTPRRRFFSFLTGFGWAYMVVAIATNRDQITTSLQQGSLPAAYHDHIFTALTVLIAASLVMMGLHLLRFILQHGNRGRNSGGVLVGALAAVTLFHTPTAVWQTGFGMMDGHSQSFLETASAAIEDSFPGVNVDSFAFVTSAGR